jgi:hypothetical protein
MDKEKVLALGRQHYAVWKIAIIVNRPPKQVRHWLENFCPDPAVRQAYRANPDL